MDELGILNTSAYVSITSRVGVFFPDSNSEENTAAPSEEVVEAPPATVEETPAEPEATEEKTAPTKGTECKHPSNETGYHHKGSDGKCVYCGQ